MIGLESSNALWGLTALAALVLLSFWRLRPARVVVPSVALWRELPARVPPVRALRRPRWTASLLAQMGVVAAGVLALAGPHSVERATAPRDVAIVVDLSARMVPHVDAAKAAYGRVREALSERDRVSVYTFPPLRRGEPDWVAAHEGGDAAGAIALAAREARTVIFVGDRAVAADCVQVLVGSRVPNDGAVDARVESGKLWVRMAGGALKSFEPAGEVRVSEGDAQPLDDVVYLDRGPSRVRVGLAGRPHGGIRRALERNPRVELVTGGAADIIVRVGEEAAADDPAAVVLVDPPGGGEAASGLVTLAPHPIVEGVRDVELRVSDARVVPGDVPVLFAGGRPIAVTDGKHVVFGTAFPPEGWALPSFPILWANVINFLAPGDEWLVRRTREPVELADGSMVRAQRVGVNRIGGAVVHANLLDRDASDLAGESRPFDVSSLPGAPEERRKRDLSAWPCAASLLCALAAWWLERKR